MDIHFSLSAGSHTVEQADILLLKAPHNFIISPLLMFVQNVQFHRLSRDTVQPADFPLIDFKDPLFYQSVKNGRRSGSTLQQFLFRYFLQRAVSQYPGKLDVLHQQCQLLRDAF